MQPRFAAPLHYPTIAPSSQPLRALAALGAATLAEAGLEAERELARAPHCGCCMSPRVHLAKFVGSTLFLDDDPAMLRLALPSAERARWSERLVAALIVSYGRARLTLFGRS